MSDYRDLKPKSGQLAHKSGRSISGDGNLRRDWWRMKGRECAETVAAQIEKLQKAQTQRIRAAVIAQRLYGNQPSPSSGAFSRAQNAMGSDARRQRITYNACQEVIDTLTSRVGEVKPRPYFLTSGGSYKQQRKAKKLNQWVEGVFYESKVYEVGRDAFRDGLISGDGFLHVFGRAGKVRVERVQGTELWLDEVEGQYGSPRNLHWLKLVDREELAAYFPEHREEIMRVPRDVRGIPKESISDMVAVAESWHLGTENDDGEFEGGSHCITMSDGTLLCEPEDWPFPWFPFARITWCKRPMGYWSQGLCEQLQGDQIELNYELQMIQKSMRLAGSFKVLRQAGSKVVKEHLNNDVGAIIDYVGQPPQYITVPPIDAVWLTNAKEIIERMRNRAGVSQMSAHGTKPAGLNSGVAIREMEDVESDRHKTTQGANDALYLEVALMAIAIGGEMAEAGKLRPVRSPSKTSFATIDFRKDIRSVKTDEFVLQCFPVSRLPRDPAGRLQTIQEYIQAGMITPRQGRRALDFADLDSIESLASAQEDLITRNLDSIIDDGEYFPPEPTDDLQLSKEMVLEYIQRYRLLGLEDEKLSMLHNYNDQLDELMATPAPGGAPTLPAGAPGEAQPQALPMPSPQSELIPNTPQATA
jgi:hypothetical protein